MSLRPLLLLSASVFLLSCKAGDEANAPCDSDADCTEGTVCQLSVRKCVATVNPAALALTLSVPDASRVAVDGTTFLSEEDGESFLRDATVVVGVTASNAVFEGAFEARLESTFDSTKAVLSAVKVPCTGDRVSATVCANVSVPLSAVSLNALRGNVRLVVSARDANLTPVTVSTEIPVTRLRWTRKLGDSVKATPAIGAGGTVFAPTADSNGKVFALNPDGSVKWQSAGDFGPFVASPSVGASLYVAEANENAVSRMVSLNPASGDVSKICPDDSNGSPLPGTGPIEASIARFPSLNGAEFAASLTADAPRVGAHVGISGNSCPRSAIGKRAAFPSNVTASASNIFFGETEGAVIAKSWNETSKLWEAIPSWPLNGTSVGTAGSSFAGPLALNSSSVFATSGHGNVAGVSLEAATATGVNQAATPNTASGVVVDADGFSYFSVSDGRLLKAKPGEAPAVEATLPASAATSLLGGVKPNANAPHLGYTVTNSGELLVWNQSDLSVVWRAELSGAAFLASPTLDCPRPYSVDTANSQPGTLYAAASDGRLFAVIVDSPHLDFAAPWPKYQRDASNGGNLDIPLECR